MVTPGADGAAWLVGDRSGHAPAPQVEVIDTTGAGDAFCAALAAALAGGADVPAAVTSAVGAASRSVTAPGTQGSYPARGYEPREAKELLVGRGPAEVPIRADDEAVE